MKKKKDQKELQSMGILYNHQIYKFLNKQNMKKLILSSITIAILATGESGGQVVQCYCKTKWFYPNICSVQADGGYCGGDPCSNHDGNFR